MQTSLEKQFDPFGPIVTPEGSVPELLRLPITTYDFLGREGGGGWGGGAPCPSLDLPMMHENMKKSL